jgi:methyl-accepting chemotaxis protein
MVEKQQIVEAFEEIYLDNDRRVSWIIYGSLPIIFIIGAVYQNPLLALSGVILIAFSTYYTINFFKIRSVKIVLMSCIAVLNVAFLQFVVNGLTEAKYFYFPFLFLLVLYQSSGAIFTASIIAYVYVVFSFTVILTNGRFRDLAASYFAEPQNVSIERFILTLIVITFANLIAYFVTRILYQRTKNAITGKLEQQTQLAIFSKNITFADEIAKGNFEFDYQLDDNDTLGKSLLNMRDNLKQANQKDEQERFISAGITEINEILRLQTNDLMGLGESIIAKLINYLEAQQGALYLYQGGETGDGHLEMIACYAYNRKKFLHQRIEIGEGMVGQCYLEKLPIYLTVIPKNYQVINAGLGNITPACLFYMPLLANERVVGVLELAFLETLVDYERRFIERIAENIATTIVTARVNEETKKLYEQARIATEELQAREEEMRQNMEELEATQEEMRRRQLEIENQNQMLAANEKSMKRLVEKFRMMENDYESQIIEKDNLIASLQKELSEIKAANLAEK